MFNYSVILTNVGSCCDRYLPTGYDRAYNTAELFERLSRIEGITGVELIGGANIAMDNVSKVKELLKKYKFKAVSVIPDHFGKALWGKGAFTAPDAEVRRTAVEETCAMIDTAREVDCDLINIWNGQDGYDYPMQVDYIETRKWLVEGIRECADYAPDIKLALEYKPKEPRNHSFISNVFSTLLLIDDIARENVGLTIDTGHSLVAYENMAEAACAAMGRGRLFHMHFNDNYRYWDDDMITGSIHTIEYIELLYWLKKSGYTGWISADQYPYREDSVKAVEQSIKWLGAFENVAGRIDIERIKSVFNKQDAVASTEMIRDLMFG